MAYKETHTPHGDSYQNLSVAKQSPRFAGTPLAGKEPGSLLFPQVSEGSLTSGLSSWETIRSWLKPHGCWHATASCRALLGRGVLWHCAGVASSHWEEAESLCKAI